MAPQFSSRAPILCAVLDALALGPDPTETASALFGAGVDWIQLRDRSLEAKPHRGLVRALLDARDRIGDSGKSVAILVNRRVDIVLSTGADGVHLGFDAIDAEAAASLLPESGLIGVSLHSIEEVRSLAQRVSERGLLGPRIYAHLAPIWDPRSKPASRAPLGPELLSLACEIGPPILAQGGLDADRARQAIAAGAAGIAVTGILAQGENPIVAARQLREALDDRLD